MAIQVDSTQDVALVELWLARTRGDLSESVPGSYRAVSESGGVARLRNLGWLNNPFFYAASRAREDHSESTRPRPGK
jgi:hypothetical protein